MTEKLRDCFDEMVVYKDLKKSNFFSALGLPSFLRDWLLKKFADDEGNLDIDELTDFIHTYQMCIRDSCCRSVFCKR